MASASTPSANVPVKKPMIKTQISGRMVSSGRSHVAIASVHSEKTRLKKLIMIIIIMKKSQETTFCSRRQKLTLAMKLRDRKVMVDFKFDALHREVFIESLLKSG